MPKIVSHNCLAKGLNRKHENGPEPEDRFGAVLH